MGLERRRGAGFKLEAVSGTPETIAAADVIYADDIGWDEDHAPLSRPHHLPTLSKLLDVAGRTFGKVNFQVPMYGGSAAGTAPFWGKILQACGAAETIVASTSVTYKLATTSLQTATIKVFIDGISYRAHGCFGDASFSFTAGEVPFMSFSFTGLWEPRTDAAAAQDEALLVGSALPAFIPKAFNQAQFKADGYQPVISAFSFSLGNDIQMVPDGNVTNYKRADLVDRNPSGNFNIEAITKGAKDIRTLSDNLTAFVVDAFVGSDASGTGTGSLNTMTDSTKNWPASKWATGYSIQDSAGATFAITASNATTVTVTGTPATGLYQIYQAGKLININIPEAQMGNIGVGAANGINQFDIPINLKSTTSDNELTIKLI